MVEGKVVITASLFDMAVQSPPLGQDIPWHIYQYLYVTVTTIVVWYVSHMTGRHQCSHYPLKQT